ncbi:MAG: IS200/IS605 family transposase [Beijerinckiaceae bacterium]
MSCTSSRPPVFHDRYHIGLVAKYRYKLLEGALRERIGNDHPAHGWCVLSREHGHVFVEFPPYIAGCGFVRRVKGWSSHRVRTEYVDLRKRYWGRHFWARGYFCTTSGNIADEVILRVSSGA